jgi:hypothetical protein
VVQYVILRKDLWTELKWPLGSVVAQACHASTAAMFTFFDDEVTAKYVAPGNVDSMHKVGRMGRNGGADQEPRSAAALGLLRTGRARSTRADPPSGAALRAQVVLEVKGEAQLRTLSARLEEAGVLHKLWVEQPEDFPTCLATKPYHKSEVAQHFKKFQLCKAALGS